MVSTNCQLCQPSSTNTQSHTEEELGQARSRGRAFSSTRPFHYRIFENLAKFAGKPIDRCIAICYTESITRGESEMKDYPVSKTQQQVLGIAEWIVK